LGTPSALTLTNAVGLPLTTGVTGVLPVANGGTGTATPGLIQGSNITITGSWPNQTITASATAATAFSALTGAVNTTAAMVVGTGASLGTSGSGVITATSVPATGVAGVLAIANGGTNSSAAPSSGQIMIAQSGTAFLPETLSGDCTITSGGAITCTKTNGTVFGTFATANAATPPAIGTSSPNTGAFSALTDTALNVAGIVTNTSGGLLGTVASVPVANGGTGDATVTAYAVLTGGTTSTGALQTVAGLGAAGQVLTSNGVAALPTWQSGTSGGETVSFSATPTFSNTLPMSTIALTGNITSFTLAAGLEGQHKTLLFIQGSGPYTVVPPANVLGFFTVGTINAKRNVIELVYSTVAAAWLALSTGSINN
jgi:hypothetical protein